MMINKIFEWPRYNQFIFVLSVPLRMDFESVLVYNIHNALISYQIGYVFALPPEQDM